jgi:heme/copper-type cytochrome/quinol oxidase subunit 2
VESNYSSNIIMTDDLIKGEKRLLQVDESLLVPSGVSLRFLITASDVLHA